MSSRSSSSNRSSRSTRKSDTSLRIVLGKKGVKSQNDDSDNDTENGDFEEITDSENSSVDGAKPKKSSSKDKERNKSIVLSPDIGQLINRILCCSCGKQLNHTNHGAVRRHPWLKVVTCKKCYKFLKSGPFTRDSDGIDEQCRWCGDGGRLYGCDYCHNCFCRSCIKRNLGRSEAAHMENEDDSKWHCYLCKPKKIKKLVDDCDQIMAYIEREEEKERERERKAKIREKEKKEREETKIKEETERETKTASPAPKTKNEVVVIENSPQKPDIKTVKTEQEKSSTKIDMKMIQKVGNAVKEKVIAPRVVNTPQVYKVQPVIHPVPSVTAMNQQHGRIITPNTSNLVKVLTSNNAGGSKVPPNDVKALQDAIFPYNVEGILEKMNTVSQSLSLTLNSIKTDLAIAKLANSNMFQAKNSAAASMKNGMGTFFSNIREIFNVQLVATTPPIEIDSIVPDTKQTSTPLRGAVKTKEDPNVSAIPIDLDDSDVSCEVDIIKSKKTENNDVKKDTEEKKEEVKENGDCDSNAEIDEDYVIMEVEDDDEDDDNDNEEDVKKDQSQKDQKVKVKASENKTENGEGKEADKTDTKDNKYIENVVNEPEDDQKKSVKKKSDRKKVKDNNKDEDSGSTVEEDADDEDKTEDNEDEDDAAKNSDTDKPGGTGVLDESENTAAELELLKEMADEINEKEKKSSLSDDLEPRRSSRVKSKKDENEETINKRTTSRSPMKSSKVDESDSEREQESKNNKRQQKGKGKEKERNKIERESDAEEESVSKRSSRNASAKKSKKDKSKNVEFDTDEIEDDRRRGQSKQKTESVKTDKSKPSESKKKGSDKSKSILQMKIVSSESDTEEEINVPEVEPVIGSGVEEDVSSGAESDDSDSSDENAPAFGERKKKRKTGSHLKKTAAEKEETLRKKVKRKMGKKTAASSSNDSDKKDEDSGSDSSNYDPELEKEIQSLSKDTRLSRKAKKEAQTKITDKKEKQPSSKKNKGRKVDDIEDLSSGTDEERPAEEDEEEEEEENKDTDDLSPSQIRKLKKAQEAAEEDSEFEIMQADASDSSTDHEVSFPKLGAQKGKKKLDAEMSDDSDFAPAKKKKIKDKLLDAKISDSDSDNNKKGKKGKKRKRKENKSESEPDPEDEASDEDGKKKKKGKGKRRRIKKVSSSEDEALKEPGADDDVGDSDEEGQGGYMKRKKIRKVLGNKKLGDETKAARKAEDERRKRIEERQKEYNSYVEVEGGEEEEEVPEGTEREVAEDSISKILGSPRKVPVTTKCILEMDEDKKPLVEIDRTLVRKLKPHQVEAVRFMFNCLVENVARLEKEEGSGAILAHCMGLGKTLSVISFVHTMLRSYKYTKMKHCLVVCPLNTVLNWVSEFETWLEDIDFEIDVYEMSRVKQNFERAQMLKEWMEGGAGVMIIGYDMYRNLVNGSHCKNKKQKKIFFEALAEPGPDLVVCDEGHILKNDQTSLSKAMMKIKTKRRVVLTGTPLQNNLNEYHCMANFVKPNLLGTRKEFSNRFANPITNGQCSDSTPHDVRLMKRRAHILHEMLAGCVQRKDYSALTKFLPPKFEYVISVRLHPLQMTLYEKYLECSRGTSINGQEAAYKGARMFRDYQALMRIWTHPWVLKLDEIRQENKRQYDESEDSFVDDNSYDDEDSFISDESSTSASDSDYKKKKKKKSKKGKKRGGGSSGSSSEEEVQKDEDKNEVVKKWTSRRRGNEEGAGSSWMEDWGYAAEGPKEVSSEWWAEFVKEEDEFKLELSGKLILLFEILRMCEDIGDKVLVFSQSLLSLDIIEDFLAKMDEQHSSKSTDTANKDTTGDKSAEEKKSEDIKKKEEKVNGEKEGTAEKDPSADKKEESGEKKDDKYAQYCQSWVKGADYFRMDGSTSSVHRKAAQDMFNDPENYRARLFLISTKAGSLGINLVSANRVIIFDASWNPSHDIQSIFRVYRFGQTKPVYVYRFLAQGTMEEKIYERQVTKQSLAQRVVDEHQIDRHFTNADLQELYNFTPDRLDDPNRKEKPLPMLPKDHMLAELMTSKKEWIVTFHEHDSLLENKAEQELTEEEKKAAWEDYENEKKGRPMYGTYGNQSMYANPNMDLQNLMLHGQANLGQAAVLQIVQDLKARFPNLPPEIFQQRVQAVLRQVLTQQIMRQSEMQRRQIDQQKMNELNRLNQIKQQIQRQQAMLSNQQQGLGMGSSYNPAASMMYPNPMVQQGMVFNSAGHRTPVSLLAMNRQLQNMQNNQSGSGSGDGSGASGTGR